MFPPLYAILDPDLTAAPLVTVAATLAEAGVQLIRLRHKRAPASVFFAEAKELVALLSPRGVRFIVNDRPDIAAISGAGGVHVGQEDLPVEDTRLICSAPRWVGVSTHNLEQFRRPIALRRTILPWVPFFRLAPRKIPTL